MTPRRIVVVGLGNYTHPLTRHSVGQLLVKNLALKAASIPRSTGSPHFQLSSKKSKTLFSSSSSSWTTKITVPCSSDPVQGGGESLEILFVIPKALMNVCGKSIVESFKDFLPPPPPSPPRSPPPPPPPPPPSISEEVSRVDVKKKNQKKNKKKDDDDETLNPIRKLLILSDDLDLSPPRTRTQRAGGPKGHNGIRSLISALGGSKDFYRFWIGIGRPATKTTTTRGGDGVAKWVLGPLARDQVESLEFDEEIGTGGEVLERAWKEVLRIGYEEP